MLINRAKDTEWEAFEFRKFLKRGMYISDTVSISVVCWNNLFNYFFMIFYLSEFQPCISNLKVTLMSKRAFNSLCLVFYFFQSDLAYILQFAKRII